MKKIWIIALALMVFGIGFNCSNKPAKLKHQSGSYLDSEKDQIERFDNALQNAQKLKIDISAPKHYKKAVKAFQKAKAIYRKGKDLEDFEDKMIEAREHLEEAKDIARGS